MQYLYSESSWWIASMPSSSLSTGVGRGWFARDAGGEPADDLHEPCATGIDHARVAEHGEQLGRAGDGLVATRDDTTEELDGRQALHARLLAFLGHLADDGEHGSLDRPANGSVGAVGRAAERVREHDAVDGLRAG